MAGVKKSETLTIGGVSLTFGATLPSGGTRATGSKYDPIMEAIAKRPAGEWARIGLLPDPETGEAPKVNGVAGSLRKRYPNFDIKTVKGVIYVSAKDAEESEEAESVNA